MMRRKRVQRVTRSRMLRHGERPRRARDISPRSVICRFDYSEQPAFVDLRCYSPLFSRLHPLIDWLNSLFRLMMDVTGTEEMLQEQDGAARRQENAGRRAVRMRDGRQKRQVGATSMLAFYFIYAYMFSAICFFRAFPDYLQHLRHARAERRRYYGFFSSR